MENFNPTVVTSLSNANTCSNCSRVGTRYMCNNCESHFCSIGCERVYHEFTKHKTDCQKLKVLNNHSNNNNKINYLWKMLISNI